MRFDTPKKFFIKPNFKNVLLIFVLLFGQSRPRKPAKAKMPPIKRKGKASGAKSTLFSITTAPAIIIKPPKITSKARNKSILFINKIFSLSNKIIYHTQP